MPFVKHLFLDQERVALVKVSGKFNSDALYARVRDIIRLDPKVTFFSSIFDVREWFGIMADDDIRNHIAWIDQFRAENGQASTKRPKAAYLAQDAERIKYITDQIGNVRGAKVFATDDLNKAWSHVSEGASLPSAARTFLG
jgi:hypothetical protein